jgi:hypothetical protein
MIQLVASRRRLLRLAGFTAGATALERAILRKVAHAAGPARRFVAWYTGYGAAPHVWYPRGTTAPTFTDASPNPPGTGPYSFTRHAEFAVSVPLRARDGAGSGLVAGPTDSISECLDARLNPYLDSLLFVRGVDGTGLKWIGHNPFTAFSARHWPYNETIDKVDSGSGRQVDAVTTLHRPMVDSPAVYPRRPVYPLLCLRSGEANANHSPRLFKEVREGKAYELPCFFDPDTAWSAIYEPLLRGGEGQPRGRKAALELAARRLATFGKHPSLSAEDRRALQEKATVLDEALRGALDDSRRKQVPSRPVLPPKIPGDPSSWGFNATKNSFEPSMSDRAMCLAQIDLMVAAIKLDLCRVYGFLPMNRSANFHPVSHSRAYTTQGPATISHLSEVVDRYTYLLSKLAGEEPGTGRSYLDNTLVLWQSDMGNLSNHHQADVMTVFAGGKGFLQTNRYLDLRHPQRKMAPIVEPETQTKNDLRAHYNGRSQSEALITAMRWMGVTPAEWERYATQGLLGFCPKVGGYANHQIYDYGDKRSPLPFSTL